MRADGEILLKSELIDPAAGSLYQILSRLSQMAISKRPIAQEDILVFRSLVEVCTFWGVCFPALMLV
jgi:charged multivesicular body protein 7